MQSAVEICNVALSSYLGARPITSLEQQTPEAEACRLHYDRVRRSLLERADWVFATRREMLARMADNDRADRWSYRYSRPAGMLKLRWVNDAAMMGLAHANGRNPDALREITADSIYSHVPAALVEFTADVTDTTLFPPSFGDALAASLAAAISMPITRDGAKQQAAQEHAAVLLEQALVSDANNRPIIPQAYVPPSLAVRGIGLMHRDSLPPVIYPDEVG